MRNTSSLLAHFRLKFDIGAKKLYADWNTASSSKTEPQETVLSVRDTWAIHSLYVEYLALAGLTHFSSIYFCAWQSLVNKSAEWIVKSGQITLYCLARGVKSAVRKQCTFVIFPRDKIISFSSAHGSRGYINTRIMLYCWAARNHESAKLAVSYCKVEFQLLSC